MKSKHLLVGASVLAFAAVTPAFAQNTNQGNCTSTTTLNNCSVQQGASSNQNSSTVAVAGTNNLVSVNQSQGVRETSLVTIDGDDNEVYHEQDGVLNGASSSVTGDDNESYVFQDGVSNTATVTISGNNNYSSLDAFDSDGTGNVASVNIVGDNVYSNVETYELNASAVGNSARVDLQTTDTTDPTTVSGANSIYNEVYQTERGNSASVVIRGGQATSTGRGEQYSYIYQGNSIYTTATGSTGTVSDANNPATGNVADVSMSGVGNDSYLEQDGINNNARISIARGGAGQTASSPADVNDLTVPGSRQEGNDSDVRQQGRNNSVIVSFGGRNAALGDGRGNVLDVRQGQGSASPVVGGQTNTAATAVANGRAHSATVFQFGQLSDVTINQDNNVADGAGGTAQFGSTANVSQSAFASDLTINQLGSNDVRVNQGGGAADVGENTSGNTFISVIQIDSGNTTAAGSGDPFDPGGGTVQARNTAVVTQAGRFNSAGLLQNATQASATLFQRRLSSGNGLEVVQGGGNTGPGYAATTIGGSGAGASRNVTAAVSQGGQNSSVRVRQDGENLTATVAQNNSDALIAEELSVVQVSQVGTRNSATVTQNGTSNTATVDQRNQNTAGTSTVSITQNGDTNIAIGQQTRAGSGRATIATGDRTGPEGDVDTRLAGAYNNGLEITQSGDNNSARIEQRGAGQRARITQTGDNNEAGILQELTAESATAIITQNGDGNSFFVTQTEANQFFRVVQSGGGNTITQSNPATGGTGGTVSPTAPAFTAVP